MTNLKTLVAEKNVCAIPWISTEISLSGNSININPCCKYKAIPERTDNLKTIWFGEKYQTLRQKFLNQETIPECSACNVANDSFSYMKRNNELYEHHNLLSTTNVEDNSLPKVFHVSLSDVCNLACRMCSVHNSTTLNNIFKSSKILQTFSPISNTLEDDLDINILKGSLKDAQYVIIAGGEPLVDKKCIDFIKLIHMESSQIKGIHFSTNLTKLNDTILQYLSTMNCDVSFGISIDGPPAINDYIRHGSKFKSIVENIKYLKQNFPKIKLLINSTLSNLNVGYVKETLDNIHEIQLELGVSFIDLMPSPVFNPSYMHPRIMPDSTKQYYLEKLSNININDYTINGSALLVNTAIKLLSQPADANEYQNFKRYITEFDSIVATDFSILYPEFGAG